MNRPEYRQAEDKRLQARHRSRLCEESNAAASGHSSDVLEQRFCRSSHADADISQIHLPQRVSIERLCPTPPPYTQGTMPFAYHNMWAADFPTFNIALVVNYPLQNHLARGLQGSAKEEARQAAIALQGVETQVSVEARNALQAYQSALSRLTRGAQFASSRRDRLCQRGPQVSQRRVDDVFGAAASSATRAGARSGTAGANGVESIHGGARARRGYDVQAQRRRFAASRHASARAISTSRVKTRALGAVLVSFAVALRRLAPPRIAAQQPPVPNVAPGYRAPAAETSAPAIAGVLAQPFVGISLQDAVAMALARNPQLAVSASNVRIARFNVVRRKARLTCSCICSRRRATLCSRPQNLFFAGPGLGGIYECQAIGFHHRLRCARRWTGQHHSAPIPVSRRLYRPNCQWRDLERGYRPHADDQQHAHQHIQPGLSVVAQPATDAAAAA